MKFSLRVKFGEKHAVNIQLFESLCKTVSLAFGGSSKEKPKRTPPQDTYKPQTADEAMAAFSKMFG